MTKRNASVHPSECAICHQKGRVARLVSFENWSWYHCEKCEVGFQYPYLSELIREEENIEDTYAKYGKMSHVFDSIAAEKKRWIETICNDNQWIVELGPGIGSLGKLLKACGKNYLAVEPNKIFAENLVANGIQTYTGEPSSALEAATEKLSIEGAQGLFLLDNVLEHIPHPIEFLSRLVQLAPQGSSVAIEVPNEAGIKWRSKLQDYIRGSRKPPTFPGHINLFTKKSLRNVLTLSGLHRVEIKYKGIRSLDDVAYLSQSQEFSLKTRLAVETLKIAPVDYLLGAPYWIRASAAL